ncbi:MAG: extracellular solute-binding protein [Clostridiales bacterium]|nr:extracellular solute-binding protein [Clostridiales bacterium]
MKRSIVLSLILAICCLLPFTASAEEWSDFFALNEETAIGYDEALASYQDTPNAPAGTRIELLPSAAILSGDAVLAQEAIITGDGESTAVWTVDVPVTGLYELEITYFAQDGNEAKVQRRLTIDGIVPYEEANNICLYRRFVERASEIGRKNSIDDEVWARQDEIHLWQTVRAADGQGVYVDPLKFCLTAGRHEISLHYVDQPVTLGTLALVAPAAHPTYAEAAAGYAAQGLKAADKDVQIKFQAENSAWRSENVIRRESDADPMTEPRSGANRVLNVMGGWRWRLGNAAVAWDFDVPESGWYNITIKGRQTYNRGSVSSRILYLDGKIPFSGMENVSFPYTTAWEMNTLSDDSGTPYRFYLSAGHHTLRLEATLGDMGQILSDMEESIYRLNQMYRRVLVLTGVNPDRYRDYHLEQVYPEVIEAMAQESRLLYKLVDETVAITGQKSDRIAVAQTLAVQLESFVEDPAKITEAFTNFKDNITSLGTSMQNMRQVKLDIDLIAITADGVTVPQPSENFLDRALHELKSCVTSYFVDYNALGDVYDASEDVLEVWILTGRDQSTVLKTMVDDTFTPSTGIPVNVMLVDPNALLNAVVAGNGPDVVISTDSWNPVNYALRHAVEDLTQFDDLQEVLDQFYPSAYAAFSFNGGLYALPETQLCSILFYRSDILEEYGLSVPETWDDLIAMLPTIQGANMSVGIPYPDIAAPNLSSYYAMLYQLGGALYNDSATHTTINSEAGVQAFERYTSLYNDYGLPTIFDFVSRFRSGEMPLGIFDYTTFNTLTVSAPEIRGLWDIAILPGTLRTAEDGSTYVDHSGHSQGACCMMIATDSETTKQNAWQFMKWWTSTDAQVRFGREIEAVLGSSARYATANIAAIEQLSWSEAQLKVIREQMTWAVGFREVAGGYYTTRHMTNAVRKVTNDKTDPRETLLDYARTINEEINKKRLEFGLPIDEETP